MSMHARRTRRWTGLVLSMGLLAVAPLNLLKGVVVSVLSMLLYKRVEQIMFKRN